MMSAYLLHRGIPADNATAVAALSSLAVACAEVIPLVLSGTILADYALLFLLVTVPFA